MRIVFLVPGSGAGFYCENCMRDLPLINALKRQDMEVTMVPIYLPLFTDEDSFIDDHGVFLGAINLYLKYKFPALKKMPSWMSRILNSVPMLKLAAKLSSSTEATSLEDMTMDMITGDMPYIEKEIGHLTEFLTDSIKPDIVHISNALLVGLGIDIKRKLWEKGIKCGLVCTLQDEHTWLDVMEGPYKTMGWETLKNSVRDVDMFFPVSSYYKQFMDARMAIPSGKSSVIFNGIEYEKYSEVKPAADPPVIGYLSRLHKGYGLDRLAGVYIRLKKEPAFKDLQLRITGGATGADRSYIGQVKSKLKKHIKTGDVKFFKHFDIESRLSFFHGMTLLSVPMEQPEAFGIYLLEAMASGIPVVQPAIGSFPEILLDGPGRVYDPDRDDALYDAVRGILLDREHLNDRADKARERIKDNFSLDVVAEKLKESYRALVYKSGEKEKCS